MVAQCLVTGDVRKAYGLEVEKHGARFKVCFAASLPTLQWTGRQIIEEVLRNLNEVPAQRLARATGRLP